VTLHEPAAPIPVRDITPISSDPQKGIYNYRVGGFEVQVTDQPFKPDSVIPQPVSWFAEALSYLEQFPLMRTIIQRTEEEGTKIVIPGDNNPRSEHQIFDDTSDQIVWYPTYGIAAPEFNGALMSPALILGHELVHADTYQQTPATNLAAYSTPNWRYGNEEEAYATAVERLTAEFLGEPQRISHQGNPVQVTGPLDRLVTVRVLDPLSGTFVDASVAPQYRYAVSEILDPTHLFVGPQHINTSISLDGAGNELGRFEADSAGPAQYDRPGWNLVPDAAGDYSLSPRPDYHWNILFDVRSIPGMRGELLGSFTVDNIGLLLGTQPRVAVSDLYRLLISGGGLTMSGDAAPGDMRTVAQQLTEAGFANIGISFTRGAGGTSWNVSATKPLQPGSEVGRQTPSPTVRVEDPVTGNIVDATVNWAQVPVVAARLNEFGVLDRSNIWAATDSGGTVTLSSGSFILYRTPDGTYILPRVAGAQDHTLIVGAGHAFRESNPGEVFLNIDPNAQPDIQSDVRSAPIISNGHFREVQFEGPLFRIAMETPPLALAEAYRILQPNGTLRIVADRNTLENRTGRNSVIEYLEGLGFERATTFVSQDPETRDRTYYFLARKPADGPAIMDWTTQPPIQGPRFSSHLPDWTPSPTDRLLTVGGGHRFREPNEGEVFLNYDPRESPDILADIRRGVPDIPDSHFSEVYFEDVPNSLLKETPPLALNESYRILGPNGTLRITTGQDIGPEERAAALGYLEGLGFTNVRAFVDASGFTGDFTDLDFGWTFTATKPAGGTDIP
jgi:hypothetical protein